MKGWSSRLFTAVLALSVVSMCAALVYREYSAYTERNNEPPIGDPEFVPNWRDAISQSSIEITSGTGEATLVEFADLQCPVCGKAQESIKHVRRKYKGTLRIVMVHLPMPYHKQALPAAGATECAREQGMAQQFVDVVYSSQRDLGKRPWMALAAEAGISDTLRFATCMSNTAELPVVQEGIRSAAALGINATPTFIINGWKFVGAPSKRVLEKMVADVLAGRQPVGSR